MSPIPTAVTSISVEALDARFLVRTANSAFALAQ
jgi:hypothetical protein